MRPLLIVFARAPRLGTVKRRLAATIGARAALRFHRETLSSTLLRLRGDRRFETRLAVTPDRAGGPWREGVGLTGQGRGDLGRRMDRAFRVELRRPCALIGCDIPDVRAHDIASAFRLLRGAHAVFGPARDGGYWLVAMGGNRPAHPFATVRWSSEHALSDTLRNFQGRRVRFLRTLADVDTAADLQQLRVSRMRRVRVPAGAPADAA